MVRASRVVGAALVTLLACAVGPRPIAYDEDTCARCRMVVSDRRYGAELVLSTGRILVYDGIECLLEGVRTIDTLDVASIWVTDFDQPGTLLPAETAYFLQAPTLASPMGGGLSAFGTDAGRAAQMARHPGTALDWRQVQATVRDSHGH